MKRLIPLFLTFVLILLSVFPGWAQCAMCRASAKDSELALGLNIGIFYLLIMPYILFSVIFLLWYWHYRKKKVVTE